MWTTRYIQSAWWFTVFILHAYNIHEISPHTVIGFVPGQQGITYSISTQTNIHTVIEISFYESFLEIFALSHAHSLIFITTQNNMLLPWPHGVPRPTWYQLEVKWPMVLEISSKQSFLDIFLVNHANTLIFMRS